MSVLWILTTVPSIDNTSTFRKESKMQGSSLLRSLFEGTVLLLHEEQNPIFWIERKQVEEPMPVAGGAGLIERIKPHVRDGRQWVVFSRSGNLALRNVDHLLPPDLPGPLNPDQVDFYFPGKWGMKGPCSDGLWAVRAEFLKVVLAGWEALPGKNSGAQRLAAWKALVNGLDLRKKLFEAGEVVVPDMCKLDWKEVSEAAFVILSDWPEDARWKFLQGLYFRTYFGDGAGVMLDFLDP